MSTEPKTELADELRDLLAAPLEEIEEIAVGEALRGRHPADIADAMNSYEHPQALVIFRLLQDDTAAETLSELDADVVHYLQENLPSGRLAHLLDMLPMDDAAEVVAEAGPEHGEELLADLSERAPDDADDVRELLSYEEQTAGRLMTDKFVRVAADISVSDALAAVRMSDPDVEDISIIYVVDNVSADERRPEWLQGTLSLRDLVRAAYDLRVGDIMKPDPVTVSVDDDQEMVADLISRYDLQAIPVLDRRGALAGIVTVDDVVDILVEEQTEDVLALGAVAADEAPYMSTGVLHTVQRRFVWLLLLFGASTLTSSVVIRFEEEMAQVLALAAFMPLLIGTGGNAGAQAVTTVTRALALGEVRLHDWLRVAWREIQTGLALGAMLAAAGFVFVILGHGEGVRFGFVVAFSLTAVVIWANVVGSLLPLVARRARVDPAVMSAPFITTLVDATGLLLYFTIARLILRL